MSITSVFKNSWEITKTTFHVMKEDKELILYPILAATFSVMFVVALLFPTIIIGFLTKAVTPVFGFLQYLLIFIAYLGLAFIATFFNVCVVYTAKKRFAGGDAKFWETLKFALSKIHLIFMWSLLAATVGILLKVLESMARNAKGIGKIFLMIIRGVLGITWSIVTIFVVPAMVYDDLTPFNAIKKSVQVLRKTWGESLVRHFGLGMAQSLVIGVVLIPTAVIIFISFFLGAFVTAIVLIVLLVLYIIIVGMIFTIANSIFNTALYEYANSGKIPMGYTKDMLSNAFTSKKAI
ncbi:MAG: DUF6159 family protein [archaeon]